MCVSRKKVPMLHKSCSSFVRLYYLSQQIYLHSLLDTLARRMTKAPKSYSNSNGNRRTVELLLEPGQHSTKETDVEFTEV